MAMGRVVRGLVVLVLVAVGWLPGIAVAQEHDASLPDIVRGQLTNVETVGAPPLNHLVAFDLLTEDGETWQFTVEDDPGITGQHAREHLVDRMPVTVLYRRNGDVLIAMRVDD